MDEIIHVIERSGFFGEVVSFTMPVPGVFSVVGKKMEGYALVREGCGLELLPSVIAYGQEYEGVLLYNEKNAFIIRCLLLLHYRDTEVDDFSPLYFDYQLSSMLQQGRVDFPDCFGEFPPPNKTAESVIAAFLRIRNGIYLVKLPDGERLLAVCAPMAETELSVPAQGLRATAVQEYMYYAFPEAAAPLFELGPAYGEIAGILRQRELLVCLNESLPAYVEEYNRSVPEDKRIPRAEGRSDGCMDFIDRSRLREESVW